MALDPQAQAILDYMRQTGINSLLDLGAQQAREPRTGGGLPPGPATKVNDRTIDGPGGPLSIRSYRPEQGEHVGALMFLHGGGFVQGDLESHDAVCRQLCVDARCVVVSVDYRLAPAHKFPAALEDVYAATLWTHAHAGELDFDPARFAVGGDSAGGNLAAAVCALSKQRGGPRLVLQLLMYPATDIRTADRPSTLENATGMFLTREDIITCMTHYVRDDADRHNPLVSLLASSDLRGLPPALVITAEHDPLRDEGEAYAEALRAAGNTVQLTRYPGMIHAFISLYAFLDQGKLALRECSDALAAALRG